MIATLILSLATAAPHAHAHAHQHRHRAKIVAQSTPAPTATATLAPSVVPTASLAPTTTPLAAPVPATQAPSAVTTVPPTPSPYAYRFVPRQPSHIEPGQPQIFAVYLNERKLRSHGPIRIKVETSPDVVKVVSRSNGREGNVPLVAAGDFEATSILPKIPFIAAGMTVDLEFIAIGPDGRRTSVRVPVKLD